MSIRSAVRAAIRPAIRSPITLEQGGGAAWSPAALVEGISEGGWYRADLGANTGALWVDQSGLGLDLTQASSGNRLTLATGLNGHACYRQDVGGGDQYFNIPAGLSVDRRAHSFWTIARLRSVPGNSGNAYARGVMSFGSNITDCLVTFGEGSGGTLPPRILKFGTSVAATTLIGRTDLALIIVRAGASDVVIHLNEDSATVAANTAGVLTGGRVGARMDGYPLSGELYETGIVDYVLSDEHVTLLKAYAQSHYGRTWPTLGQVVIQGDSLSEGSNAGASVSWPRLLDDEIGGQYKQVNLAFSATYMSTAATYVAEDAAAYNAAYSKNIAVLWMGKNDLNRGDSAATVIGNIQTWLAAMKAAGFSTIVCTDIKQNGATWSAGDETNRLSVNTSIRALSSTYADAIVDLDALTEFSDTTNTTYYNADQVHLTAAGYEVVKTAIKPAVLAL